ncbi:MAG: flagellar hook protein FlgE [Acidimicrobiales bacterium]
MYSAVSGLRAHQIMMDVVGNNIANVNTQGYKRNTAIFQDVLSQVIQGASTPTEEIAGRNPAQVGLGVMMSGTAQQFGQGFLQITNRSLDVAIQGDGFFVLDKGGESFYTRAGALFVDADARLVTSGGGLVKGWGADAAGNIDPTAESGVVRLPVGDQNPPLVTTEVKLGGNLPATASIGNVVNASVEVFNSSGDAITVNMQFEKTAANEWTASATYGDAATPLAMTDNVLTFADGELTGPGDLTMDIAAGQIPGVEDLSLVIGGGTERRVTQYSDSTSLTVMTQNGAPAGVLQTIRVGSDGVIVGTYSNGLTNPIAMLAIANFSNPEGLERVTGSNWRATSNSGLAQLGTTNTGGRGTVAPGTLEMSNVDLASEFTELIRSQRGFQANSRVITSSDELLQEIVNLKR